MTDTKALAVQAMLMAGAVVRIELRKAGKSDPDQWWLGHLDTIAELLLPSPERRETAVVCARLRTALEDLVDDLKARWDMRDYRTNPGIRHYVEQAEAALASTRPDASPGEEP